MDYRPEPRNLSFNDGQFGYVRKLGMTNVMAERLLLSRRDMDMTQIDLASKAGNVSAAYISDLERSKVSNPTVEVIQALADALGVRPEYLLGWTEDPLGEDQPASLAEGRVVYQVASPVEYRQVQELLDLWQDLTSEDQRMILEMAQHLRRVGNARIIGT